MKKRVLKTSSSKRMRLPQLMKRRPPLGPEVPISVPVPKVWGMSNGLRIFLIENHDLPLCSVNLAIMSGTAQDHKLPGTAFSTAALVDEGAGNRSSIQISSHMQKLGSSLDTVVDCDTTVFSFQIQRQFLGEALDILADVILCPHFSPKEFKRITDMMHSRAIEQRQDPAQVADLAFRAAIFGSHPYGRPLLPHSTAIRRIKLSDLERFHRNHYRPNNAVFVAAGAVTMEDLLSMLQRRFAKWRPRALTKARLPMCPKRTSRILLVDRKDASESILRVGHSAPHRRSPDFLAIEVLNTIFGGSFTSRLNLNLREKRGFTYGASSSFTAMRHGGFFSINTSVEASATLPALMEILNEMTLLGSKEISAEELEKAKHMVVEGLVGIAETNHGLVDAYTELAVYRLSLQTLKGASERIVNLSLSALRRLALRYIRCKDANIVIVGEASKLSSKLSSEFGIIEKWNPEELH